MTVYRGAGSNGPIICLSAGAKSHDASEKVAAVRKSFPAPSAGKKVIKLTQEKKATWGEVNVARRTHQVLTKRQEIDMASVRITDLAPKMRKQR